MLNSIFETLMREASRSQEFYPSATQDPRDYPTYTVAEAAALVNIPRSTLSHWVRGPRDGAFAPIIKAAQPGLLSFYNLVEAHVLRITRCEFSLPMIEVRRGLDYAQKKRPSDHPLLTNKFWTDGKHLFVWWLNQYINVSKGGQLGIGPVLELYLQRIRYDEQGLPFRLFPVSGKISESGSPVMIDPDILSGRLVISGTRISVVTAWERLQGGESYEKLARDYRIESERVRKAIEHLAKAS